MIDPPVSKAVLIHDAIFDHSLDIVALTETDAQNAVSLDVAPAGYLVIHAHRGTTVDKRGDGNVIVFRESIEVRPCN